MSGARAFFLRELSSEMTRDVLCYGDGGAHGTRSTRRREDTKISALYSVPESTRLSEQKR
jgi:hypothetical protein